jgi:hypothetical protein
MVPQRKHGASKEAHRSVEADERVSEPTGSYLSENAKHSRPVKSGKLQSEILYEARGD